MRHLGCLTLTLQNLKNKLDIRSHFNPSKSNKFYKHPKMKAALQSDFFFISMKKLQIQQLSQSELFNSFKSFSTWSITSSKMLVNKVLKTVSGSWCQPSLKFFKLVILDIKNCFLKFSTSHIHFERTSDFLKNRKQNLWVTQYGFKSR